MLTKDYGESTELKRGGVYYKIRQRIELHSQETIYWIFLESAFLSISFCSVTFGRSGKPYRNLIPTSNCMGLCQNPVKMIFLLHCKNEELDSLLTLCYHTWL